MMRPCWYVLFTALLLVVVAGFTSRSAVAQSEQRTLPNPMAHEVPTLRFEHLGLDDGMAQSSGLFFMQDREGYLWVGTQGGLHRYDGYTFDVYKATPFDTTSLSDNWVWGIAEAQNGDLWVATGSGGLNRMDRATGTFTHYRHDPADPTSLSSDNPFQPLVASNGDLWVSTFNRGLNRMRAGEEGRFTHYRHDPDDPNSLTSDEVIFLREDADGQIWAGSHNGINRIDPETNTITRFLDEGDGTSTFGDPENAQDLYLPPEEPGIVWAATGNGLVRLDSRTGDYERFLIAPNEGRRNPLNYIWGVMPDPSEQGVLWVVGPGTGVVRFDAGTRQFTSYRHDPSDPYSVRDNRVEAIFTDRSGTIWVGTSAAGLSAFNPQAVNFSHLRHDPDDPASLALGLVWGIYEDRDGTLWVNTSFGVDGDQLTQFDAATGRVMRHRHNPNNPASLLPGNLRTFAEDEAGQFWIGGTRGLNRLDRATGRVTRFLLDQTEENPGRNSIHSLLPDPSDPGTLWVGGGGGINRFDTRTGAFTNVPLEVDSLIEISTVRVLAFDSGGILWAGTVEGLVRVDPAGGATLASAYDPADTTRISSNTIHALTERAEEPGILWLATGEGGLNRFDTRTGLATHYTEKDGLANDVLYSILEDNSGTLWMSTNRGISNFDPNTETFRNYGLDDGLIALEYDQHAYAKGAGGVLYFGCPQGVTAFVPERLHINEVPPEVVLSDFRLFNQPVAVGPDSPLQQPLSETEAITLRHNQNEVTFAYVALHFANAAKNQYAYRLDGYDEDWVEAGTQRVATYTNLRPGRYRFHVKAANADGVWNEEGASVALRILSPWYQSWWAYLLYAIGAVGLVVGIVRERTRHLKVRQRELEQTVEERTAEIQQRVEELAVINGVQEGLVAELDMQAIYDLVGERIRNLFDAQGVIIATFDHDAGLEHFQYAIEKGVRSYPAPRALNKLRQHLIRTRKMILINEDMKQAIANFGARVIPGTEMPQSVLFAPLIVGEDVRGYVSLQNVDREQAFPDSDVRLLTTLTNSMSVALENARLFDETTRLLAETEQRNAELGVINSVQEGLVAELEMQAIYDLVGERIRNLFDAQVVVIRTYNPKTHHEEWRYGIEKGKRLHPAPRPIGKFQQQLIETRAPVLINEDFVGFIQQYTDRIVTEGEVPKSALFVPMVVGDTVRGDVSLQNVDREHAFSDADLRLLSTLTNSMSVALENARLFDETRQQATELDTVNRVSKALVAQLDFDALVHLVGERMRETFDADIVYVALHDREANMIRFPYEWGDTTPDRPFGSGFTEKIITTREPILTNQGIAEVRARLGADQIGKVALSYLGVPIMVGEEAIGVISVQSTTQENLFGDAAVRLLSTIAANVGVALNNAEAYRKLEKTLAELKTTQQQLVQQEKMASLGALTAGIAHEIKNPLNFINNFAEVNEELAQELREALQNGENVDDIIADLEQNAAVIAQHGKRADGIVKSMMAHAREGKGERELVNLNALIDEHIELAYHGKRAQVPGFNVTIERDYDEAVGEVEVVLQDIGRVVLNLMGNAFDAVIEQAASSNGKYEPVVQVSSCRKADGQVEIRLEDNGPGMSAEVKAKVFEPFFTTKPTGSGTGLGLSLSYDIITQGHGGTLAVETTAGEGATFVITLPPSGVS